MGGRHYVFITNTPYDGCAQIRQKLALGTQAGNGTFAAVVGGVPIAKEVYSQVAWCGVPMLSGDYDFDSPLEIPSDVRLSFRNKQGFRSRTGLQDRPTFRFNTKDHYAVVGDKGTAEKSLMEQIRVVPNPYYAYSQYEKSQLQTLVKITNLPRACKIRIYTLNGTLVRTYNKDSEAPHQDWDLKNHAGVPVASGVYIIHIDGYELGEKVLKFFGVLPQLDLSAY